MQRRGRDGVVVVLRRRVVVGEDVVDGWVVGFRRGGRVIVGGCGCGEEGEQGLEVGRVRGGGGSWAVERVGRGGGCWWGGMMMMGRRAGGEGGEGEEGHWRVGVGGFEDLV